MKEVKIPPIREDDIGMSVFIQDEEEVVLTQETDIHGEIISQVVNVPDKAIVLPDVCTR